MSCKYSRRLNNIEIMLCEKKKGINPPHPIPFIEDRGICVSTEFESETKHLVPKSKIYLERMNNCSEKEEYIFQPIHIYEFKR